MTARSVLPGFLLAAVVVACGAAPPAPDRETPLREIPPVVVAAESEPPRVVAMIESPPVEPVDAPRAQAAITSGPSPDPLAPRQQVAVVPPVEVPAPPPIVVAAEPTPEEREFAALLSDLQRYNALGTDDVRREQQAQAQALQRTRSDYTRVRLAVLYTLVRTPADDQRALQLFDTVAKSNPGSVALKQLAAVLSAQVAERVRAVRDEQARSEAALQKLEALRAMERSLLRDRVRSGGGGGGAGSGAGN